ncbi:hypothetical protein ACFY3M_51025 [Streptomyces mirabilis]
MRRTRNGVGHPAHLGYLTTLVERGGKERFDAEFAMARAPAPSRLLP